jgi:hypothetical protein
MTMRKGARQMVQPAKQYIARPACVHRFASTPNTAYIEQDPASYRQPPRIYRSIAGRDIQVLEGGYIAYVIRHFAQQYFS